ncbi:MAG: hypothetical protein Q9159_000858 [Coniocarpon cinnabarinum]
MHLLKSTINPKYGTGVATLLPHDVEDMWALYNLVRATDVVRSTTFRKVTTTSNDDTGDRSVTSKRTTISVRVEKTSYDAKLGEIKVQGRVCKEDEWVEMGAYHTLTLAVNRQFTLEKGDEGSEERWDTVACETLQDAVDEKKKAEVWGVVMEEGSALVCIFTASQALIRQRVEVSIPRSSAAVGAGKFEAGMAKFFKTTMDTLLRAMEFEELMKTDQKPPLVVGSTGFTAQKFLEYVRQQAWQKSDKKMAEYFRSSALVVHTAGGKLHNLSEALSQPDVKRKLADTKFGQESVIMERFLDLVREDQGRAWYGAREVVKAINQGAVGRGGGTLLISNALFRSDDVSVRRKWVDLVERVRKDEGGEVRVLSSAHETGKRLETLGSIGCITTYPVPGLDEESDEES